MRLGWVIAVFVALSAKPFNFRFGGGPSFLEYFFHAVIGGGRLELVCSQADGLLDCRIGGGEKQHPDSVSLDAIVIWVRHGHRQDFPFAIEGLDRAAMPIFRWETWSPTLGRPYGAAIRHRGPSVPWALAGPFTIISHGLPRGIDVGCRT